MYALHFKIKEQGHENLVLETEVSESRKRIHSIRVILRNFYMNLCRIIRRNEVQALNLSFSDFKKRNIDFTRVYGSMEELRSNPPSVDALITGSDQVWNMATIPSMIPSRFLDFGTRDAIRFSFAASIENMHYSESQKEYAREQLKKFKGITLREKTACDFIESFTGLHTEWLLDPVFLLDKKEWIARSKTPRIGGPYILCYQVLNNELMQSVVNRIKKETGYPVVSICYVPFNWIRADYSFYDVSPEEFLGLFNNAACVVTTSFHGTSFGVIFNKKTYTIPRDISANRICELMKVFGLEEFIIRPKTELSNKTIDWNKVNELIEKERGRQLEYLHKMLS